MYRGFNRYTTPHTHIQMPEFVTGKYIEDNAIENRDYQTQLVNAATTESTLIALPTGSGKTPVAVRAAMRRLEDKGGRILMVAPQTPLVHQHARTFKEMTTLPDHEIQIFTGSDTAPTQRKNIWNGDHGNVRPSVVIATPQVIEKDLVSGSYTLEDVTHLIVDECHRTTGDYAYVYIGERYNGNAENPLVTGMSASLEVNEKAFWVSVKISALRTSRFSAKTMKPSRSTSGTRRWNAGTSTCRTKSLKARISSGRRTEMRRRN